jgi:hypothetical protein
MTKPDKANDFRKIGISDFSNARLIKQIFKPLGRGLPVSVIAGSGSFWAISNSLAVSSSDKLPVGQLVFQS